MIKARVKHYVVRAALIIAAVLAVVSVVIIMEIVILSSHSPSGPGQAKGLSGRYYNLVYALTPCPSAPLEEYEDENIRSFHFRFKDSPNMDPHSSSGESRKTLAETMLKYIQVLPGDFGNIDISKFKPKNRKPAGLPELMEFVEKYALENIGVNPEIKYGNIPGSPFSAHFTSGSREGICFTDLRHNLYCFKDQDLAMQRGAIPFIPRLIDSLGLWTYSVHDYAHGGLKRWFVIPYYEKRSECNFIEIERTIRVKGPK
ncbi:MAG: hypothetical protein Q7R35_08730 [Elusimicrobiota bacterium]|nr:hypothetical protein [Elusimicrobiota bacterium]